MIALFAALLCLALNAFFVAAEFALVKVRATQIAPRAKRGERRAVAAEKVLARLDRYLSVTQLGITVASLGLGWIAEPAIARLGDRASIALTGAPLGAGGHVAIDVVGLGILTYLHLLLGELVPKFIAIQRAEQTTLWAALPLEAINVTLRPILWVLERSQAAVLRLFGLRAIPNEGALSEDEILGMLAANALAFPGAHQTQRRVERVVRMGKRPIRSVMVPRVDVVTLPIEASGREAFDLLKRAGFSRLPLTRRGSVDDVVGYLYAKEFLLDPRSADATTLEPWSRRAVFLPATRDAASALGDMQRERTPIAIVVDEYGGTSGIVTLEDLVEQVFGEIQDELDAESPRVVPAHEGDGGRAWDVDVSTSIEALVELGIPLHAEEFEAGEHVAHILMRRLGHLPRLGERVTLGRGVEAIVTKSTPRRIERVRLRLVGTPDAS